MSTTTEILLSGALAAFSVDLLIYPLDTLKTRIQAPDQAASGAIDPAKSLARRRDLYRGLYRGVGVVILATLPASGTFFLTYESTKSLLSPLSPHLPTPLLHAASSTTAELASCAILTPFELIKQNTQVLQSSSSSHPTATLHALRTIRAHPSPPTLLVRSYLTLVTRNLPFTALHFPVFEALKKRWTPKDSPTERQRLAATAAGAGVSGAVAAVATTPIDVVKARVMVGGGGGRSLDIAREVWQNNGVRGISMVER